MPASLDPPSRASRGPHRLITNIDKDYEAARDAGPVHFSKDPSKFADLISDINQARTAQDTSRGVGLHFRILVLFSILKEKRAWTKTTLGDYLLFLLQNEEKYRPTTLQLQTLGTSVKELDRNLFDNHLLANLWEVWDRLGEARLNGKSPLRFKRGADLRYGYFRTPSELHEELIRRIDQEEPRSDPWRDDLMRVRDLDTSQLQLHKEALADLLAFVERDEHEGAPSTEAPVFTIAGERLVHLFTHQQII